MFKQFLQKSILHFTKQSKWRWMPDGLYLRLLHWANLGKWPNLRVPKTFNEKLQWLKLHDRNPVYRIFSDKYLVRKYIMNTDNYKEGRLKLIPLLAVWDQPEEIQFSKLPDYFVLKCNHDSGGVIVCRNKSELDTAAAIKKIQSSFQCDYYWSCREWGYKGISKKIFAEQYMEDVGGHLGLTDYKFYCFNGVVKYLYVSQGLENHKTAKISFLTPDWQFASFARSDYTPFSTLPDKPKQLNEMIRIAEQLSAGFPFLRVDLYIINDEIFFSELTLYPCAGFMPFQPVEWDEKLGEMLDISNVEAQHND